MCVAYVLLAVSHDGARLLPLAAAMRNALRVCLSQVVPPERLPLGRAREIVSESAAVQESLRRHRRDASMASMASMGLPESVEASARPHASIATKPSVSTERYDDLDFVS